VVLAAAVLFGMALVVLAHLDKGMLVVKVVQITVTHQITLAVAAVLVLLDKVTEVAQPTGATEFNRPSMVQLHIVLVAAAVLATILITLLVQVALVAADVAVLILEILQPQVQLIQAVAVAVALSTVTQVLRAVQEL
jgi:hypothetical protein